MSSGEHLSGDSRSKVFYEPAADRVTIYSVFHCSQDPQKWRSRLGYIRVTKRPTPRSN